MTIVIETPKGSQQKYNYDNSTRFFKLKKVLPSGMVFPFDFGFVPGTEAEDGDPVDALLLNEFASFPGCMIECRVLGAIQAVQHEGRKKIQNDRLIAVSEHSRIFSDYQTISDVPEELLSEIESFFIQYNAAEGKIFTVERRIGTAGALKKIKKAMRDEIGTGSIA